MDANMSGFGTWESWEAKDLFKKMFSSNDYIVVRDIEDYEMALNIFFL